MAGRTNAAWTVDIDRPPSEVFAYLQDVSRHGEWSPKPFRVEGLPPGPVSQGMTFVSYGTIPGDKNHRNDVEVTEVVPPGRLVFKSNEPKGDVFINTFIVTPTGSGSRVERNMDMPKPGGLLGAIFPVFLRAYIRPTVQKGMDRLKRNVEAAPTSN